MPEYKILVDVEGLPPHLYRTKQVARAIGTFGTYLGSIHQSNPANLSRWSVAVAVDKLERVPHELEVHAGGFEYVAIIQPRKWIRANLYKATDLLPKHPKFTKNHLDPKSKRPESPEHIHISMNVLRDICRDKDPRTLPPEIQAMLSGASDSRVISVAQVEQMAGIYASVPEYDLASGKDSQGGDDLIQGLDDIMQTGQDALKQVSTSQASTQHSPQPIIARESPQPVKILQRSASDKTNSDEVQNQRRSPDQSRPVVEGSGVRMVQSVRDRQKESKCQKGNKNKIRQGMQHSSLSAAEGTRPNSKPIKRNTVHLPPGPISRQLLRGESSWARPNAKDGKKAVIPPRQATFKKPIQISRRGRLRRVGDRPTSHKDDQAEVRNTEGFYEVAVEYSHLALLASGCGLQVEDVDRALQDDNHQRLLEREHSVDMGSEEEEGPDITFDPEMEEDIESAEDLE